MNTSIIKGVERLTAVTNKNAVQTFSDRKVRCRRQRVNAGCAKAIVNIDNPLMFLYSKNKQKEAGYGL